MKIVVLYSGGLDSTTVLAEALNAGHEVLALSIDYGQGNGKELDCCRTLAKLWGFEHHVVNMDLPEKDPTKQIPARNTLFLAKALEYALRFGAKEVHYGAEPDSTYVDSSIEYISAQARVFELHGVQLRAPIKTLPGKRQVLERALGLGVPLDLVHSSLTNAVDGACKTSKRFLEALGALFPALPPEVLLAEVAASHAQHKNPFDIVSPQSGSFKYLPALFVLGSLSSCIGDMGGWRYTVYTTGNWGLSLCAAKQFIEAKTGKTMPILNIERTQNVDLLRKNELNTNWLVAQWGVKQALSRLPRPTKCDRWLVVRYTQGHLFSCLNSMGYRVLGIKNNGEQVVANQNIAHLQTES